MTSDPVDGLDQLLPITQKFYQPFYTTDPVDDHQVKLYLNEIQDLL